MSPSAVNLGGQASEEVVLKACPFCQRDETALEGNKGDRDRGAEAIAAVPPDEASHAFDMLREYHGKTNSWGARAALTAAVGMLRGRYQKARCDSDGVAGCVRCTTMFLVRSIERLLAAEPNTRHTSGDTGRIVERLETIEPRHDGLELLLIATCRSAARHIEQQAATIAGRQWQPIETALEGQWALISEATGTWMTVAQKRGDKWFEFNGSTHLRDASDLNATHWMPLPEPPATLERTKQP